jgi:hypothetical protein
MRNVIAISIAFAMLPAVAQPARVHVQIELVSAVRTKKAKVGDKVKAKTASPLILPDGTAVPATSPITGTIREVTADSGGKSSVSISFDQVEVFGKKMPAAFFVQAAMMPGGPAGEPRDPATISPSDVPHDHAMAGRRQTVQDSAEVQSKAPSTPAEPGAPEASGTTAAHTGSVIGVPGLTLQVDEDGRQPTKFESNAPNLELKPGLQLMLTLIPQPGK